MTAELTTHAPDLEAFVKTLTATFSEYSVSDGKGPFVVAQFDLGNITVKVFSPRGVTLKDVADGRLA